MTHTMVRGAAVPVRAAAVHAAVFWTPGPGVPDVDLCALLLSADGRARSDADLVFYNQPRHPSGRVRHHAKRRDGGTLSDAVELELAALGGPTGSAEPPVQRVLLVASADGGALDLVPDLRLAVYGNDGGGVPLAVFAPRSERGAETALVCGELYRAAGGEWTFRALGQGHPGGLAGLVTAVGIAVDDVEEAARPAAPPPTAARQAVPPAQAPPTQAPATQAPPGFTLPPQGPRFQRP